MPNPAIFDGKQHKESTVLALAYSCYFPGCTSENRAFYRGVPLPRLPRQYASSEPACTLSTSRSASCGRESRFGWVRLLPLICRSTSRLLSESDNSSLVSGLLGFSPESRSAQACPRYRPISGSWHSSPPFRDRSSVTQFSHLCTIYIIKRQAYCA